MSQLLQDFFDDLKKLRQGVKAEEKARIQRKSLRDEAERLGSTWFREIVPTLPEEFQSSSEFRNKYDEAARRLIKLSAPNNRKSSYTTVLDDFTKKFRDELILPAKVRVPMSTATVFDGFVTGLKNPEESEYLQEAINCARNRFLRAATVLVWCSAIDRIHRKIESIGFPKFNVTSSQMASQQKGRYKRFSSVQNVSSLSELREVFDNVVLWIIEGMGLIDSNQHTRLKSCFDMRNHSAHPGDAPITEFNLLSMFSDIQQIVLENPNFDVEFDSNMTV